MDYLFPCLHFQSIKYLFWVRKRKCTGRLLIISCLQKIKLHSLKVNVLVTRLCLLLCDFMNCSPPGFMEACPWNTPGKNTGVGGHSNIQGMEKPLPSPGDLPYLGVKFESPALQEDSLPWKPLPKCKWGWWMELLGKWRIRQEKMTFQSTDL